MFYVLLISNKAVVATLSFLFLEGLVTLKRAFALPRPALMFGSTFASWFVLLPWSRFGSRFGDPSTLHPFQSLHRLVDYVEQTETFLMLDL